MKVNNISFGQTYYNDSLSRYMNERDRNKLHYSYSLGDLYPVDIILGSDKRGDLTVKIRHISNDWDQLVGTGEIPPTPENLQAYFLLKQINAANEAIHGPKYPTLNGRIRNLHNKSEQDIKYEIQDLIGKYYEKYGYEFLN